MSSSDQAELAMTAAAAMEKLMAIASLATLGVLVSTSRKMKKPQELATIAGSTLMI